MKFELHESVLSLALLLHALNDGLQLAEEQVLLGFARRARSLRL